MTPQPSDSAATPPKSARLHLRCKACGHWKRGRFTKDEVADWLRVHRGAMVSPEKAPYLNRESTCPNPCGGVR